MLYKQFSLEKQNVMGEKKKPLIPLFYRKNIVRCFVVYCHKEHISI